MCRVFVLAACLLAGASANIAPDAISQMNWISKRGVRNLQDDGEGEEEPQGGGALQPSAFSEWRRRRPPLVIFRPKGQFLVDFSARSADFFGFRRPRSAK